MHSFLKRAVLLGLCCLLLLLAGCASRQRGRGSSLTEGDSANIHYTSREDAGGRVGGR